MNILYSKIRQSSIKLSFFNILFLLIIAVFFLFPTNQHLSDSYEYAACVKHNESLFAPHHLLYNFFNYLIYQLFSLVTSDINVIRLMQYTNTTFAIGCLFLINRILILKNGNKIQAQLMTLFAACSFGFMRFSTEVETYIIPLFFSLISTLFFLKIQFNGKTIFAFLSGLFASLACLFHQIHIFWGIGIFVGFIFSKNIKTIVLYLSSTPIVLIVYAIVVFYIENNTFTLHNFLSFFANYYYSENADTSIGLNNLIITVITFTKTFFQIHGSIVTILKLYKVGYLIIVIVLYLVIYSCILTTKKSWKINQNKSFDKFSTTIIIIFILQLSFAFFSHGNSEFMIMLPFLISIILHSFFVIDIKGLKSFILAMFIWNLTFGILSNHFIDYQNNKELVSFIKNNPKTYFILKENFLISSIYYYEYGVDSYEKIISNNSIINKKSTIKNGIFYTDILTKKTPYSRVEFTTTNDFSNLQFIKHVKWINNTMGGYYIDQVSFNN